THRRGTPMKRTYIIISILVLTLIGGIYFGSTSNFFKKTETHESVEIINNSSIRVYKDALDNIKMSRISIMDFPDRLYLMGKVGITEDRTTVIPSRVT